MRAAALACVLAACGDPISTFAADERAAPAPRGSVATMPTEPAEDAAAPNDPSVLARPIDVSCGAAHVLWFVDERCIACIARTCCRAANACAVDADCRMLPRCVDDCRQTSAVEPCVRSCASTAGATATAEYEAVYDTCSQSRCGAYCPALY